MPAHRRARRAQVLPTKLVIAARGSLRVLFAHLLDSFEQRLEHVARR